MSWIGWCILCAAIYVGYLLLRAATDAVHWAFGTFVREPKERERLRTLARERRKNAAAAKVPPQADAVSPIPMIPKDQGQKIH